MSTLALDGSSPSEGRRAPLLVRYADLALLAIALPIFLVFGFPMLGYTVAAAAWLAQRAIQLLADRRAAAALVRGERRTAMGTLAATTLARVWLIALAVLLVGLAERKAGLAAAVLSAVLFTAYLAGQGIAHLLEPEEGR